MQSIYIYRFRCEQLKYSSSRFHCNKRGDRERDRQTDTDTDRQTSRQTQNTQTDRCREGG